MSHVGWRLMVASMAKARRPRPAAVRGASSFMRRTKSATSASEVVRAGVEGRAPDGTLLRAARCGVSAGASLPPILVLSLSVMARPAPDPESPVLQIKMAFPEAGDNAGRGR